MTIVGVDAGSVDVRSAEHVLAGIVDLLGEDAVRVGCTHLTRAGGPHVVLSLELTDPSAADRLPPELRAVAAPPIGTALGATCAAAEGAAAHRDRRSGRAVHFPGQERLTGVLTAGELVAVSTIDRVVALAGPPVDPATRVDTRGFVRPQWEDGLLTLHAVVAAGGVLAPFEVENPTPCCADHA